MSNGALEQALPIIASTLGDQMGVRVRIEGTQAYTDFQEIVIPAVNPATERRKDVVVGYISHESSHLRFTDEDAWNSIDSDFVRHVTNILEDVRIELAIREPFPGTRLTISQTIKHLCEEGRMEVPDKNDSPAEILTSHILFRLRFSVLGMDFLQGRSFETEQVFRNTFPTAVPVRLHGMLSDLSLLQSTSDCIRLAQQIRAMIEEEKEKEQQKQSNNKQDNPSDSGSQQSSGLPSDDSSNQMGQGDSQDENGSDGQNNKGPDDNSDGQNSSPKPSDPSGQQEKSSSNGGQSQSSSQQCANVGDNNENGQKDYAQILTDTLSGDGVSEKDLGKVISDLISDDVANNPQEMMDIRYIPSTCKGVSNELRGLAYFNHGQAISSPLRSRLEGLVQADRSTKRRVSSKGKNIVGRRMCRALGGDIRIFSKKSKHKAPDTAIHFLVDRSVSMKKDGRLRTALEACLALCQSLEGIDRVSTAASAFPAKDENGKKCVEFLKGVNETTRNASKRFGISEYGATPLGEAMYRCAIELTKVKAERQILFVLTDGEPDSEGTVNSMVNQLERAGIDMIAIGIGTNAVQKFFEHNVVISDINDLLATMFKLTQRLLVA